MKLVFTALLVCIVNTVLALYGPELKEKVLMFEDDCFNKTLSNETFGELELDNIRRTKALPGNGLLDEFAICILQKYNVLNDDGSVNENVDKYYLISDDPKKGKQQAVKCKMNTGNSINETARNILNCFLHTDIHMIDANSRLKIQRLWNPILPAFPFVDSFVNRRRKPWMPPPFYG